MRPRFKQLRDDGRLKDIGLSEKACGVVFESPLEEKRFYLAGDTIFCGLVVEAIERFHPGIVAVNAGGAQFPLGHLLIMNQYDVRALMHRSLIWTSLRPTLKVFRMLPSIGPCCAILLRPTSSKDCGFPMTVRNFHSSEGGFIEQQDFL